MRSDPPGGEDGEERLAAIQAAGEVVRAGHCAGSFVPVAEGMILHDMEEIRGRHLVQIAVKILPHHLSIDLSDEGLVKAGLVSSSTLMIVSLKSCRCGWSRHIARVRAMGRMELLDVMYPIDVGGVQVNPRRQEGKTVGSS